MQHQRSGLRRESHVDANAIDDPTQQEIVELLESGRSAKQSTATAVEGRLTQARQRLLPIVDRLADEVQEIEHYRRAGDQVSSRVLAICAARLEERNVERNRDQTTKPGLGRILGALSRLEMR